MNINANTWRIEMKKEVRKLIEKIENLGWSLNAHTTKVAWFLAKQKDITTLSQY